VQVCSGLNQIVIISVLLYRKFPRIEILKKLITKICTRIKS
jgi:hypothetical protein